MNRLYLIWGGVFLIIFGAFTFYAVKSYQHKQEVTSVIKATPVPIGGPFKLTNHWGKTITDKHFPNKYLIMYFGYTFCPDICPTALQNLTLALEDLGEKAGQFQPVFVTIDPQRDTMQHLAEFVKDFHPSLMALRGTPKETKALADAYKIYYAVVDPKEEHYMIDHTSLIYVMNPKGEYVTHFRHNTSPKEMRKILKKVAS
jgi:cytochrome oxidase Cu insertion factor (SCO1/SenC/PrrC family)